MIGPLVIAEDVPYAKEHSVNELELTRPLGGPLWWNSLYWTNFPALAAFNPKQWEENPNADFYSGMALLNTDKKLSEQYVTFGAARDDLCASRDLPKTSCRLTVECMQYEGVRDCTWNFPLEKYIPRRDNHQPHEIQSRRFHDNGVLHLGLNAEEFSDKVAPVGSLNACITIAEFVGNPTWGYYPLLMRIGGWPYRIKKMGTFEGHGDGGHEEINIGIVYFDEKQAWQFLEGEPAMAPTGPNGEMELQGNLRVGYKYWAQLYDLDWLGPKMDDKKHYDPSVPHEKGYVWFTVVETVVVPSTGMKGIKIQLLDEGIVPAWLDLNHLQVFAGSHSLGYLDEAAAEGPPGSVGVFRTPESRKVVVENGASRIVFDDPIGAQMNDFVDMGWAIFDCLYKGATVKVGPKPGKWALDVGGDEGSVDYKASGPSPLLHGHGDKAVVVQAPKSDYLCERRLVV